MVAGVIRLPAGIILVAAGLAGPLTVPFAPTLASASADPLLAAVGDIACPAGDSDPEHGCQQEATARLVASQHPDAVAPLGDVQYESALLSEFQGRDAYNETWGQFDPIAHPVTGNHEYAVSPTAEGYFAYFGAAAPGGYYSYELGAWHVVALSSDCSDSGCEDSLAGAVSSTEVRWLQGDLAAHQGQCVLAYWHHPLFTSGWVGNSPGVAPLWEALYAAHADVVVNGHDHLYERFAPQDTAQQATNAGIREFVVGTGGESLFTLGTIQPNLQFLDDKHYGVLFLTLHPGSYEWAYRATDGAVLDSGSDACHLAPSTPAPQPSPPPPQIPLPAQRLAFAVQVRRVRLRAALSRGLPVSVYCSRACDVQTAIHTRRRGRSLTLVRLRRTETQLTRPHSLIRLRLPARLLRGMRAVRLALSFIATDASREQRRAAATLTLR
jgi:hypothetical protein